MGSVQVDIQSSQGEPGEVRLSGRFTLAAIAEVEAQLNRLPASLSGWRWQLSQLEAMDSAGALCLWRAARSRGARLEDLRDGQMRDEVVTMFDLVTQADKGEAPPSVERESWMRVLERIGLAVLTLRNDAIALLGFVGLTLQTLAGVLIGKRRLRWTATVHHMEQTGFDAVPIVALLSFLVGSVVAFLGATVLRDFGASIFTVELVSFSFLREFGVLLTAILLAGRSGSAFTAQIGAMKSREELDAMRALGLDPVELLVVPRLLALLLMLPVLTFVAMLSGLLGGALVGSLALDISPGMFLSRLHEMTEVRHFYVGMVKAPVFAFLIAVVGCLEGMKVAGSAESVGKHTTSSVVQAIFLVILFDALFAIFFMEMDW
ncbi:ABC transporter permease [Pseudomarimonas arenosa]|uniref:MlaE family lipid ABC transporter permease subunit n=1 Tax=Pseudomarimonas arenosa TaxID=2774145 RepID=A0AAW3ZJ23_9GAMM|nr:MlaE family lipid ABC transporter permease subunit [Pseudomarimonas arenosa]MBD8525440.1 MlaE family lipid ABC transporter permease subunit [Pseudomarimonas arenosa]